MERSASGRHLAFVVLLRCTLVHLNVKGGGRGGCERAWPADLDQSVASNRIRMNKCTGFHILTGIILRPSIHSWLLLFAEDRRVPQIFYLAAISQACDWPIAQHLPILLGREQTKRQQSSTT